MPAALAGVVAVGVNGQALPAAGFMALTCLLVAPANAYENGLLSSIPTVVSIYVCIGATPEPAVVGGWMLFGGALAVLLLSRLRQRIGGTVGGGVAALVLASLAPPWLQLAVALVLLVLMLAYPVTGQYALFVACLTPFIVLLSAGTSEVVDVVLERLVLTLVASLLAGLVASAVVRRTRRLEADVQAPT